MKRIFAIILTVVVFVGAASAQTTDKGIVKAVQTALNAAGYDCGTPDGLSGKKTDTAISQYQQDNGLQVTGDITHEMLAAMGLVSDISEKPILFMDIPWGTAEADVRNTLVESGFANPDKAYKPANFIKLIPEGETAFLASDLSASSNLYPDGGYGTALDPLQQIAGYDVKIVEFCYLYGIEAEKINQNDSRLISAIVNYTFNSEEDGAAAAAEILTTLEKQYGSFDKYTTRNGGDKYVKSIQEQLGNIMNSESDCELQCIKYGAENTALLMRVFGWNNIKLFYFDTNASLHADALANLI